MNKLQLTSLLLSNSRLLFSERQMLRERFLNGYSREEMAYRWGVSVERVERIEKDAIKKVYKTVDGLFKEKEAKR